MLPSTTDDLRTQVACLVEGYYRYSLAQSPSPQKAHRKVERIMQVLEEDSSSAEAHSNKDAFPMLDPCNDLWPLDHAAGPVKMEEDDSFPSIHLSEEDGHHVMAQFRDIEQRDQDCSEKGQQESEAEMLIIQSAHETIKEEPPQQPKYLCFDIHQGPIRKKMTEVRSQKNQDSRKGKTYKSYKGRKAAHPEMERELVRWMRQMFEKEIRLTQDMIRQKACELAQECPRGRRFNASKGWLEKFLKRNPMLSWMLDRHRATEKVQRQSRQSRRSQKLQKVQ